MINYFGLVKTLGIVVLSDFILVRKTLFLSCDFYLNFLSGDKKLLLFFLINSFGENLNLNDEFEVFLCKNFWLNQ